MRTKTCYGGPAEHLTHTSKWIFPNMA